MICVTQSYNPNHKEEAVIYVWKRNFKWETAV